ncbi:MAG: GNAT family N-acetyltransferase [Candidatus Sericytochromatia bacterium]
MKTRVDWAIEDTRWRDLLEASPGATFFHTPGWYRARAGALGLEVATAHLAFDDGAHALLPLAIRPLYRGLVRGAASGLENGYGGLLSPSPLGPNHLAAAQAAVAARFGDLEVTGNPHAPTPHVPPLGEGQADTTLVLPILPAEAQLARMSGMRARHVRKAARSGFRLEVRRAVSAADAEAFFPLYQAHAARWNYTRWVRDRQYFRTLLDAASPDLVLFLAYQDEQLAAFHLVGLAGEVAIQLHLATDEAADKANVGTWLIAESLSWLHAAGLTRFDFLPSGQLTGVSAYKASFGAEPAAFETRRQRGWLSETLGAIRRLKREPAWAPST